MSEEAPAPLPSVRQQKIESFKRSMEYHAQEAAAMRDFKSCVGKAKYHGAMAKMYEYQCDINKLEVEDDGLDPDLVADVGEEFARQAKLHRQETAFKNLAALRKADKLSAGELVFILQSGHAAGVTEKELA